ncbi:hypothetical protein [Bacillus dakarensis]|uniref:hypothetical protein n=1 Tax=Robertmurraya dakarensis TaxID=1926278 RepID=UPI0009821F17|nr:hypothetical protein [Bacillus dakarensis]
MLEKLIKLVLGYLCGFLFIKCVPFSNPFHPSDLIVEFLFNPLGFFGASVFFIIGFLLKADLISNAAELMIGYRKASFIEHIMPPLVMISFVLLFLSGFWQTTVFFCFSILYGIISLDFQKFKMVKD